LAQQTINIGTIADDGTGDSLRTAGTKLNEMLTEIYSGEVLGSADSTLTASATPPEPPIENQLWYETDTGVLHVRYHDGSSSQWVAVGSSDAVAAAAINFPTSPVADDTHSANGVTYRFDGTAWKIPFVASGLTTEQVDDRVAALLTEGDNITITYNDGAGTLTIDAAAGGDASGINAEIVTPSDYGLIADGTSNPLSGVYANLAAAQAAFGGAYYFVTDLTQEIDYCAVKAASNAAFGPDLELSDYNDTGAVGTSASLVVNVVGNTDVWTLDEHAGKQVWLRYVNEYIQEATVVSNTTKSSGGNGILTVANWTGPFGVFDWDLGANATEYAFARYGENGDDSNLNKRLYLPAGDYQFGADTWTIRNLRSGVIEGAGRLATNLNGDDVVLAFDGLWYSKIGGFSCTTSGGIAAIEVDGESSFDAGWQQYETRGVQGVTFHDLYAIQQNGDYALTMLRQGGSSGQGDGIVFINCHLNGADEACYYQNGFNALSIMFLGGNFQDYPKYGAYITGGTCNFYGASFQSNVPYTQYVNGAFDIFVGYSAAGGEGVVIENCRSEGLQFLTVGNAVNAAVRACSIRPAIGGWSAATAYTGASDQTKAVIENGTMFVATTTGTSHATDEPAWSTVANGGTIADGTVVWTRSDFDFIYSEGTAHTVDLVTCNQGVGRVRTTGSRQNTPGSIVVTGPTTHYVKPHEGTILVDATAGAVTIELEGRGFVLPSRHRTVEIIRLDSTVANLITISAPSYGSNFGTSFTIGHMGESECAKLVFTTIAGGSGPQWQKYQHTSQYFTHVYDAAGTLPATKSDAAFIYADAGDGDLKVKFGDGTVKTLSVDT
jgi:hypothetical protein